MSRLKLPLYIQLLVTLLKNHSRNCYLRTIFIYRAVNGFVTLFNGIPINLCRLSAGKVYFPISLQFGLIQAHVYVNAVLFEIHEQNGRLLDSTT